MWLVYLFLFVKRIELDRRGFCLGAGNAEARKCSKMPGNPTRQVHALLGGAELELLYFW